MPRKRTFFKRRVDAPRTYFPSLDVKLDIMGDLIQEEENPELRGGAIANELTKLWSAVSDETFRNLSFFALTSYRMRRKARRTRKGFTKFLSRTPTSGLHNEIKCLESKKDLPCLNIIDLSTRFCGAREGLCVKECGRASVITYQPIDRIKNSADTVLPGSLDSLSNVPNNPEDDDYYHPPPIDMKRLYHQWILYEIFKPKKIGGPLLNMSLDETTSSFEVAAPKNFIVDKSSTSLRYSLTFF